MVSDNCIYLICKCRTHVWGHFCLCYDGQKLLNDKESLRTFGIKDGDQVSQNLYATINYFKGWYLFLIGCYWWLLPQQFCNISFLRSQPRHVLLIVLAFRIFVQLGQRCNTHGCFVKQKLPGVSWIRKRSDLKLMLTSCYEKSQLCPTFSPLNGLLRSLSN